MSVPVQNYEIEQGEDTMVSLVYKTKSTPEATATPVDLTGHSVRMDIAVVGTGTRIWTFNSSDNAGSSPIDETGTSDNEAVLGSDGSINILVPRALTLPTGTIFVQMQAGKLIYSYDLFLRRPDGLQKKLLEGTMTVNTSTTLWA